MSSSLDSVFGPCVDECASYYLPAYNGCDANNETLASTDYTSLLYCSCNTSTGALLINKSTTAQYNDCVDYNNDPGSCTDEKIDNNHSTLFLSTITAYCRKLHACLTGIEFHTNISLPAIPECPATNTTMAMATTTSLSTSTSATAALTNSLCTNDNDTADGIVASCTPHPGLPNTGAIAGGVVGGVAAFVALVALAYIFILKKRRRPIASAPFEIINATDATNTQIEAGLNNLATEIKSIATKAGASNFDFSRAAFFIKSTQDEQRVASFIKSIEDNQRAHGYQRVDIEQREKQFVTTPTKVDATQALQASIAMILGKRVLPYGYSPMHPLFDEKSQQWREFKQWVAGQPAFAGYNNFKGHRRRQWFAKYVKENIASNTTLMAKRHQLITDTTREIEDVVYQDSEDKSLHGKIERLVGSALDLTVDMLGLDLPIIAIWVQPGEVFSENYMELTDISRLEGVVALCIFPRWADSESFTIVKAKVYVYE